MKASEKTRSDEDDLGDLPPAAHDLLVEAMRRANTYLAAASACPRRACRTSGKCHLKLGSALNVDCGAGLTVAAHDIGRIAFGLVCDFIGPKGEAIGNLTHCADLWLQHRHLVEAELEARRKAARRHA